MPRAEDTEMNKRCFWKEPTDMYKKSFLVLQEDGQSAVGAATGRGGERVSIIT